MGVLEYWRRMISVHYSITPFLHYSCCYNRLVLNILLL